MKSILPMTTVLIHKSILFHDTQSWCLKKFVFNEVNSIPWYSPYFWKHSFSMKSILFHDTQSRFMKKFVFNEVNPIPWHGQDSWKHSCSIKSIHENSPDACENTRVLLMPSYPVTIHPLFISKLFAIFAAFSLKFHCIAIFYLHEEFLC